MADAEACGPDVEEHVEKLRAYEEAGYDELYVSQVGPDQDGFFEFYSGKVLPALRRSAM